MKPDEIANMMVDHAGRAKKRTGFVAYRDAMTFGIGMEKVFYRSWWNPMRWIKGPVGWRSVGPKKLLWPLIW